MVNKKTGVVVSSLALLVFPGIILAATDPSGWFKAVIENLLAMVIWPIFIGAIVIMFIFAGFMFVTAAGDPAKIATARKAVIWATVGIIVGFFGYFAYGFITKIFNV